MNARVRRSTGLLAVAVVFAFLPAASLAAQDTIPPITPAQLEAYTKAYIEIAAVRDESYGELGRTHEAQGKAAIRLKMEEQIAKILEAHQLTPALYRRITWSISSESAEREIFEKMLATLAPRKAGG